MIVEFLEHDAFLAGVHILDSLEDFHVEVVLVTYLDQVLDVLGEQRAAVTAAREDVLGTNAAVGTHTMTHHVDVGTHDFTQVGNLVHETNACGEHRGGSILDHLGRACVGIDDGAVIVHQDGAVQALHGLTGAGRFGADDDAVGLHEVLDAIAFGKEIGVAGHVKLDVAGTTGLKGLADDFCHVLGGAHRHC